MEILDARLDLSAFGNIKDLSLSFPLSFKERSKILNSVRACRDFFTHLFKWKPDVKLLDLQFNVEESSLLPNRTIFKKINEDIKDGSVSLSLSNTLGELATNPRNKLYVQENIVDNLAPEEGNLLPNWKHIASLHGYRSSELMAISNKNYSTEGKTKKLLTLLCANKSLPSLSSFMQNCRDIKRNDIAGLLVDWCNRVVSTIM